MQYPALTSGLKSLYYLTPVNLAEKKEEIGAYIAATGIRRPENSSSLGLATCFWFLGRTTLIHLKVLLIMAALSMSQKRLFCYFCEKEAVFALQPPLKMKACPEHTALLNKQHSSVFNLYDDFIEGEED